MTTAIMGEKIWSIKFWLPGLMHTAESEFSNFMIKYLDKIGTKLENILVWLSWTLLDSNYEEKKRPKISWRPPFKDTRVLLLGEAAMNFGLLDSGDRFYCSTLMIYEKIKIKLYYDICERIRVTLFNLMHG